MSRPGKPPSQPSSIPPSQQVSSSGSIQSLSAGDDSFRTPPSRKPSPISAIGVTPSIPAIPKSVNISRSPSQSSSVVSSGVSVMSIPSATPSTSCVLPGSVQSLGKGPTTPGSVQSLGKVPTTPGSTQSLGKGPTTQGSKKSVKSKKSSRGTVKSSKSIPLPGTSGTSKISKKSKKSKIAANYCILISGTETESEASSVDPDVISQFKVKALAEKAYNIFRAVESGSLSGFKEAWDLNPGFDVNTKNPVGYTILHIAIRRQHEDLVKEILKLGAEDIWPSVLYDVLLHSIQEQSMDLVTKIYEVMEMRNLTNRMKQNQFSFNTVNVSNRQTNKSFRTKRMTVDEKEVFINSEFDADLTPLLLAAQVNSYELVDFFFSQGHKLPAYHNHNCNCDECKTTGLLRKAIRRLIYNEAVSKQAYLCYQANVSDDYDMVLEIFNQIEKLRLVGNTIDVEFKSEYREIREELKEFACSILQQCKNSAEVELLLNKTHPKCRTGYPLPRLQLAMKQKLKKFVALPHSQQILYEYWAGRDWPKYRSYGPTTILIHLILRFFTWPFIAIWMLFERRSKWGRKFGCPASRCLSFLASYLLFLVFLVVIVSDAESANSLGPPATHLELPVLFWIMGFIFSMIRMFFRNTQTVTWIYFDAITYVMFIVAIISGFCGMKELQELGGKERKDWNGDEATLVSEAFLACATVCAFFKLFRILQLHLKLGPLITAIGRMSHDVFRMIVFFVIILFAFGLAFKRIYRPYQNWQEFKEDGSNIGNPEKLGTEYTSLHSAIATLYWTLFGLGSSTSPNMVGNTIRDPRYPTTENKYITVYPYFPQLTGKILLISYTVVAVSILLNLLLGLMSKTYDRVYMEESDSEWKFARSTIWISFMRETVNPPPLNLIPTIPCLAKSAGLGCCKPSNNPNDSRTRLTTADYNKLIRTLIQRHFRDINEINNTEDAKQDIVDALEEDMAELRALIDEIQQKTHGAQGLSTPRSKVMQSPTVKFQTGSEKIIKLNASIPIPPPTSQIPVNGTSVKATISSPAGISVPFSSSPSKSKVSVPVSKTTIPTPPPPPIAQPSLIAANKSTLSKPDPTKVASAPLLANSGKEKAQVAPTPPPPIPIQPTSSTTKPGPIKEASGSQIPPPPPPPIQPAPSKTKTGPIKVVSASPVMASRAKIPPPPPPPIQPTPSKTNTGPIKVASASPVMASGKAAGSTIPPPPPPPIQPTPSKTKSGPIKVASASPVSASGKAAGAKIPPPPPPPPIQPSSNILVKATGAKGPPPSPPPPPPIPTPSQSKIGPKAKTGTKSTPGPKPVSQGPPSLSTIQASRALLRQTNNPRASTKSPPVIPPIPPSRPPSEQSIGSNTTTSNRKVSFSK